MKSHKRTRELLIIRLICYSFIAWAVTYVYLNSWTGLNVNKLEQERISRIQKKEELKKSLDVLIEAGFSDQEVFNKEVELLTYFLGEKDIDESKKVLESMERTLRTSTSLLLCERVKAQSLLIMGKQYLSDFDRAEQIAKESKNELRIAFEKKEIEPDEYERLTGIIQNNLAVSEFLKSRCEENAVGKKQLLNNSISNFAKAQRLLERSQNNNTLQKISKENLTTASREALFEHD